MLKRSLCLAIAACLLFSCAFALADEDPAVAVIDGIIITRSQLDTQYESQYDDYALDDEVQATELRLELLDQMLRNMTESIMLKKLGLDVISEEERSSLEQAAKLEYENYIQYFMVNLDDGTLDPEELRSLAISWLESLDMSEEDYIAQYIESSSSERLYAYVTDNLLLTEEQIMEHYNDMVRDAKAAYENSPDDYIACVLFGVPSLYVPQGIRVVRRILIAFDEEQSEAYLNLSDASSEGKDVRAQMSALYGQLDSKVNEVSAQLDGGVPFVEVEQIYSDDTTLIDTGLEGIGYYVCEGCTYWDDELVKAAMDLAAPGEISRAIRMSDGISIFYYESELKSGAVPFEEVKDYVTEAAYYIAGSEAYLKQLDAWREELGAEIYLDALE